MLKQQSFFSQIFTFQSALLISLLLVSYNVVAATTITHQAGDIIFTWEFLEDVDSG